jgi:leucyl-tRNA synthetase
MFLHDLGLCKTQEPFLKLVNQGMILGENHKKMSKSLGNTINPDVIIEEYGADTLRLYEMFLGPISVEKPWSEDALEGAYKFVKRFFTMYSFPIEDEISPEIESLLQQTIKKVTDDYSNLDFNTAISQVMIMVNEIYRLKVLPRKVAKTLLIMLNPICPHLTEELNQSVLKSTNELAYTSWPEFDESKIKKDLYSIAVSINGKLRATLEVDIKENEEGIKARALALDAIQNYVKGNEIKKIIYVSGKIINIVI